MPDPQTTTAEEPTRRDRFDQGLLIVTGAGLSWLLMQAVHEFGHVLHAWWTGGRVAYVVLHPFTISMTHYSTYENILFLYCGGFLWGSLIPWAIFLACWRFDREIAYLPGFFAGFCLIANGAYLAGGAVGDGGDPQVLTMNGVPVALQVAIGLPMVAVGIYLWHGIGPNFGLGEGKGKVDRRAAIGVAAAFAVVFVAELLLSPIQ
ncbi:MAG: M50 family metallopeptidase [Planctomycetales bacterium]